MHRALVMLSLLVSLTACREAEMAGAPLGSVDSGPPDIVVRIPYSLQGVPGPWWRDNAMHEDFEVDQRACRAVSTAARKAASGDDRNDAAYRAFLDCMTERSWTRGVPPPQTDAG